MKEIKYLSKLGASIILGLTILLYGISLNKEIFIGLGVVNIVLGITNYVFGFRKRNKD